MSLLELDHVSVAYGNIGAVHDVSLNVERGEIVTLIGANGAGKTTTLRAISGLLRSSPGQIRFDGRNIERTPAYAIARSGIAHAPEGRHIFPRLTVRENLVMGAYARTDDLQADFERVHELFPILKERSGQRGETLSGGEQQMLAIGRALMSRPSLLLLDEPSLGLAPRLVQLIFETLAEINRQGTTILLVEQNANQALALAARGYVMETGTIVLHDTTEQLRSSEEVRKAYLGEE